MPLFVLIPAIAIIATLLAELPLFSRLGLSALPLAILLGITAGHLTRAAPGPVETCFADYCRQRLLRYGIVLFGFSISFVQILDLGWQVLLLDVMIILGIFLTGILVGIKLLRLEPPAAILVAAGSAICGAAAVLATDSVVKSGQRQVSIAVATVILFGTLAMFSYPLIYPLTGMDQYLFGIYIGSTVHEVAQAVAAGEAIGGAAMQNAVVVKLIRVMLLAPFLIILSALLNRGNDTQRSGRRITVPWFVLGFVATAAINSQAVLPAGLLQLLEWASQLLLAMAMTALGIGTRWSAIREAGLRPLMLSFLLFILLLWGGLVINQWLIMPG